MKPKALLQLIVIVTLTFSISSCWRKQAPSEAPVPQGPIAKILAPAPPPTTIEAVFSASNDVNPDSNGRPSSIVVRIYELNNLSLFNNSDFFSLYKDDENLLGKTLIYREQFYLSPGGEKQVLRQPSGESKYFAVFAGYRDLHGAVWKGSTSIAKNQTSRIMVTLDAQGLTIQIL